MVEKGWAAVTGASSGIGRSAALALAQAGWNVALHNRASYEAVRAVAQEVGRLGRQTSVWAADFGQPGAAAALAESVWQAAPIDVWCHAAGVDLLTGANRYLPFAAKLEAAVRVDLIGTIEACRAVGSRMSERGRGSIVTIGWDQSATGMEGDSGQLFAAVKGGVAAFTRSLARSLAPAVRVNCIAPGWIRTAWGEQASLAWQERVVRETPLGRWGEPADVAAAVVFLADDASRFITGQTINVNGGAVAS